MGSAPNVLGRPATGENHRLRPSAANVDSIAAGIVNNALGEAGTSDKASAWIVHGSFCRASGSDGVAAGGVLGTAGCGGSVGVVATRALSAATGEMFSGGLFSGLGDTSGWLSAWTTSAAGGRFGCF